MPSAADESALKRWAAHGYQTDPASLGETGSWTQLNERDLAEVEQPVLPDGFRFRTAGEARPQAAAQAHVDAWAPSTYTAEGYEGVRRTATYRSNPPRPGEVDPGMSFPGLAARAGAGPGPAGVTVDGADGGLSFS